MGELRQRKQCSIAGLSLVRKQSVAGWIEESTLRSETVGLEEMVEYLCINVAKWGAVMESKDVTAAHAPG